MEINKNSEYEIISKIKEGQTSEFKVLVDKYKAVSFSLACSILKNEQDAEDALQESFIKAFKSLSNFNFDSSFSTWFYKIVVNTCKTKYSKQRRVNQFINFNSNLRIDITENNTPLSKIDKKERGQLVNKILDVLKPDESLLLRLFYLAELNIKEIVSVTDFTESKVKVTLLRARNNFKENFEKMYGTEITTLS